MKVTIKSADWLRIAAGQSPIINGAYDDMNEMYRFLHKNGYSNIRLESLIRGKGMLVLFRAVNEEDMEKRNELIKLLYDEGSLTIEPSKAEVTA